MGHHEGYKLLFGLQRNWTNTFTTFCIRGCRDKWRHLWLRGRHTSCRLVLSAETHVQFVSTAQRETRQHRLQKIRHWKGLMQKITVTPGLGGKAGNVQMAKEGKEHSPCKEKFKENKPTSSDLKSRGRTSGRTFTFFTRIALPLMELVCVGEPSVYQD